MGRQLRRHDSNVGELATVHMLWHGAPLTRVERVSMASFAAHGHRVLLHAYDELEGVPPGIELSDAARVLPRESIFRHARTGSLAVFADWFRYRLLLEHGGIWVDADVVCLKPLVFDRSVVCAWQDDVSVCGAVLGMAAGHPLAEWMIDCCEHPARVLPYDPLSLVLRKWRRRLLGQTRPDVLGFGEVGPRGLTRALRHTGLLGEALPSTAFYPVHCDHWRSSFDGSLNSASPELAESSAIHLWHEMMRREPGFDAEARFPAASLFEQFCERYLPGDALSA